MVVYHVGRQRVLKLLVSHRPKRRGPPTPFLSITEQLSAVRLHLRYRPITSVLKAVTAYEQVVANSLLDPTSDPAAELVVDARSRGRYVPFTTAATLHRVLIHDNV